MTLRLVTDASAPAIAAANAAIAGIRVARPASLPPASDRLVVVEASAGTGKTYFLEHRVVDLILAGAELGQILLVTFTDKAVAELRMRIRDLLDRLSRATESTALPGDPAWTLDEDARRKLRAAVTAFDYAPIFTIHSFCHRVLVEDAFAARRLFEQTQIADEVAFDAAFDALLRERFARVQPDRDMLHAYLSTDRTVDHLRKLLLQCARADAPVRRQLDPERARAIARELHAQLGETDQRQAVLAPMKGNYARWCAPWLDKIGAELAQWKLDTPTPELLALIDRMREPIEKLHEKLVELLGKNPPTPVITALRGVLTTVSLNEALATELLPHILARVEIDKSERGLFDYDDMLELVARALRGPRGPELATRLRARTPWVMIDEFQDTDPVQWEIFRTVWMHQEAKGLTIVGDPKQAIYGFRGADVATYMAARDEMLRNAATRVALDVNRRSTPQLVEAVNHILVGNFGLRLLDGDITYDEPVTAAGDILCDDRRAPVEVMHLQSSGKPKADENKATLLVAIGDAIEKLRRSPMRWQKRGAEASAFALGHVMVLTRSNRDSTEIATALRARGLACALVEPEKLFETREAYELAAVLAAIAAPRDRSARMRALRTRFFDVPWAELPLVTDAPDHHPLVARLFDWAQLATRRAYEALFRRLVEDSRFAERALVLGGGERALTNTWHLIELLLAEVARARCDLHELVVQLRRWMADDTMQPDERDVQRAETEADAIRILTIHKAKGLEAPYVFVYGGLTGAPKSAQVHTLRDPAGRALIVGQPDPVTKAQLENEQLAEDQRLAYVALTRAQVRLYLPLYPGLTKGASYGPVQTCLGASVTAQNQGSLGRVLFEDTPLWVETVVEDSAPLDALATFDAPAPPMTTDLPPLAAERGGLTMLSYTRLANLPDAAAIAARPGDLLAIDPAEFDIDDAVGEVGPDELPPGASAGLLVHDVLELADLELARDARDVEAWRAHPEIRPAFVDAARDRGIDERFLRHASELVYRTLTLPLALSDGGTLPSLVNADAIAREVEFNYPIPGGARRGLVKGFIDALVVYGDELWVLDYKTDVLSGEDLSRAAELHVRSHYAVQARLYAIAADKLRGQRKLAGLLYQFVRHDLTVPLRIQGDTLALWTAWLAGLPTLPAAMSREIRP